MGTYVVTGGAMRPGRLGIGGALKQQLLDAGHSVIAVDRSDAEIVADLSEPAERLRAVEELSTRAPEGIDGMATCAAVGGAAVTPQMLAEVNFFGTIDLINGARPLLKKKAGSVVVVSSHTFVLWQKDDIVDLFMSLDREQILAGIETSSPRAVYASGKRALVQWMRSQVAAYAADGVRLNTVVPGFTDTPLTSREGASADEQRLMDQFQSSIPLGQRMGQPEEVASAIEFLLSPKASFVCGSVLYVDGGHDVNLRPGPVEY